MGKCREINDKSRSEKLQKKTKNMIRFGLLILSIVIVAHAVEKDIPPPIPSLKTIVLENVQVGVQELDQKLTKVSHPDKIAKVLVADHHQKLILKFSIKN